MICLHVLLELVSNYERRCCLKKKQAIPRIFLALAD